MIRQQREGVPYLQFESLAGAEPVGAARLVQAVSTRLGGVSMGDFASLNLGHTVGDRPEFVNSNHQRFYGAVGISAAQVITAHQVHSNHVERVGARDAACVVPATDGLISAERGVHLLLRFADCVPILFYAPTVPAVGIAHAGWRGSVAGIAAQTVAAMQREYGCQPDELYVGIGPAIGLCCYQVGAEVLDAARSAIGTLDGLVSQAEDRDRAHLDLLGLNAALLRQAGVRHIEIASLCTACHTDTFYSHRAEQGKTGRMAALIGLT